MYYESFSKEDTFNIGMRFGSNAGPGGIYCLTGDLAAGKTVFAKGFGFGMGVAAEITSPTFTIMNIYMGRHPFYHFDVYRLQSIADIEETGYEEYFFAEGVCLLEWADMVESIIPPDAVWITIERDMQRDEDYRWIGVVTK